MTSTLCRTVTKLLISLVLLAIGCTHTKVPAYPVSLKKRVYQGNFKLLERQIAQGEIKAAFKYADHYFAQCGGASDEAKRMYVWILEREPNNLKAQFTLGETYLASAHFEEALAHLESAQRLAIAGTEEKRFIEWKLSGLKKKVQVH